MENTVTRIIFLYAVQAGKLLEYQNLTKRTKQPQISIMGLNDLCKGLNVWVKNRYRCVPLAKEIDGRVWVG